MFNTHVSVSFCPCNPPPQCSSSYCSQPPTCYNVINLDTDRFCDFCSPNLLSFQSLI